MGVVFDEVQAELESEAPPAAETENQESAEVGPEKRDYIKRLIQDQQRRAERLEAD